MLIQPYISASDPSQNLDQVTAFTTPGIQFRFRGYTEVFTIKNYVTELKYTYTNGSEYTSWCGQQGNIQACDEATKQLYYPGNRNRSCIYW